MVGRKESTSEDSDWLVSRFSDSEFFSSMCLASGKHLLGNAGTWSVEHVTLFYKQAVNWNCLLSWFETRGQLSTTQPFAHPFPLRNGKEKNESKGSGIKIRIGRGHSPLWSQAKDRLIRGRKKITLIQTLTKPTLNRQNGTVRSVTIP